MSDFQIVQAPGTYDVPDYYQDLTSSPTADSSGGISFDLGGFFSGLFAQIGPTLQGVAAIQAANNGSYIPTQIIQGGSGPSNQQNQAPSSSNSMMWIILAVIAIIVVLAAVYFFTRQPQK